MNRYLIEHGYIPLDKSWVIRMGVLDLLNNYEDTIKFLEQKELNDDLQVLYRALIAWKSGKTIDVGESGTIYRFLRFASWKLGVKKVFILQGTLRNRKICNNSKIVNYSQKELLKLDNGTSQWASAAVLLGDAERLDNPPYKLRLTYKAVEHWKNQRAKGSCWKPRYDETILRQAEAFLELLKTRKISFAPRQAEDYCFARAFEIIGKEEGESRWPSLHSHESDRIEEMEKMLSYVDQGIEIDSVDHRIIQAVAMRQKFKGKNIKIKNPKYVNKSWPQFWRFLNDSDKL